MAAERRLPGPAEEHARRFIVASDELDVLTALDADETSAEWWTRLEQDLGRMADAARLVARALIAESDRA